MRRLGLQSVMVLFAAGCSQLQDFDRYTAGRADGSSVEDSADVALDTAVDTFVPPTDDGTCPDGRTLCDGACVDTQTDRDHCGSCSSCEDQGVKGAAQCVSGSCSCRSGATRCGDLCTYLDADPLHCGTCETTIKDRSQACYGAPDCAPGLRDCVPWSFPYTSGGTTTTIKVVCPTSCLDTGGEGNHCYEYGPPTTYRRCYDSPNIGWCIDNVCTYKATGSTSPCTSIPDHVECPVSSAPIDSGNKVRSCVDKMRDPNHCGSCGNVCAIGDLCLAGACTHYRPARAAADCVKGWSYCTPPGWSKSVCVQGACPS
jgi:hypothetical protein